MTTPRVRYEGKKPPDIDLVVHGLEWGPERKRFRCAGETRDPATFEARKAMVRDLGARLLFPLLRGRLDGKFSTQQLHDAYRQGGAALAQLLEVAERQSLVDLVAEYRKASHSRGRDKQIRQIDVFIEWAGKGAATTADLTAAKVSQFLGSLTCGSATKNRYRSALGAFCSFLCRTDRLIKHPIAMRSVPRLDEGARRMPDLTADEYRRYFEALPAEHRAFFRLLVHTGADVAEVHALQVGDCLLDREVPRIRLKRSKVTRSIERLVPYPKEYVDELKARFSEADARVFAGLDDPDLWASHLKARNVLGRPDLRRKDLRHIAAIYWRRAGADLSRIRDWLGHSTISQTVVYSNFGPDDAYDGPWARGAAELMGAS